MHQWVLATHSWSTFLLIWCGDTLLSRSIANAMQFPLGESGKAGQEPSHGHHVVTATNTDHSHIAVSVRQLSQQTFHLPGLACSSRRAIGIEVMSTNE